MNDQDNPYLVLGLDRTADDRAVKKAYAAKLREFSPESHPEEFKRVRAAYELLADREARERYDAADKSAQELPEEVSRRIADIDAALSDDKTTLARGIYDELLERYPTITWVRFRFTTLLMRLGEWEPAIASADLLVAADPTNALFHVVRARALRRANRRADAAVAFREAARHGTSTQALIAAAEGLALCAEPKEGLAILDRAIATASVSELTDCLIEKHSILLQNALGPTDEVVARLRDAVRNSADPVEAGRYTASRMGSAAAFCFAQDRPADGQRGLADCEVVFPEGTAYLPVPAKVQVPIAALPDAARKWLASYVPGDKSPTIFSRGTYGILFLAFCALALVSPGVVVYSGNHALGAAMIFGAVLASALLLLVYLRRIGSDVRAFTTIESPYVVEVHFDRATFWSLVALEKTAGTNHYTNGVYTHTAVKLHFFGQRALTVTIRNKADAERWMGYLGTARGRSLELMGEGVLEGHGMTDVVPPRVLASFARGKGVTPKVSRTWRQVFEGVRLHALRKELVWLGLTLVTATGIFAATLHAGAAPDAWVVNALDVPVTIVVDGRETYVPAGIVTQMPLRSGTRRFQTKVGSRVIASTQHTVPSFSDAVVFNVLGAAPIYSVDVHYGGSESVQHDVNPMVYAGQELVVERKVDYVMRNAPSSISSSSGPLVKRRLDVFDKSWETGVNVAYSKAGPAVALAIARAVVGAEPDNGSAVSMLSALLDETPGGGADELAALQAQNPGSTSLAAAVAGELVRTNRLDELAKRFSGTSPADQLGRAIGEPLERADRSFAQLATVMPDDHARHTWAGRLAAAKGDYAGCARELGTLVSSRDTRELAECLVASGDTAGAERELADKPGGMKGSLLERANLAIVAGGTPAQAAASTFHGMGDERQQTLEADFRVLHDLPPMAGKPSPELALLQAIAHGVDAVRRLPVQELGAMMKHAPYAVRLLVIGELVRTDPLGARSGSALAGKYLGAFVPYRAVEAWVLRGESESELWRLRLDALAALDWIRARTLRAQHKPYQVLEARAARRDVFGVTLTVPKAHWPKP